MRLGIYYHVSPHLQSGGGAVFQETLLEEIKRVGKCHEVFLFSPTAPEELREDHGGIRFIALDAYKPGKLRKASKVLSRVTTFGSDNLSDKESAESSLLDRAARENKIDLLWFISIETEKVTVPYIATVWDLAHRTHPYFPEVSVTGWKWKDREQHYRELLPRAACIITGTSAGKEEIVRY